MPNRQYRYRAEVPQPAPNRARIAPAKSRWNASPLIRDDNDLLYNLHISIPQATLGATVEIPTVEGKVKTKIDPGTQPGKILRLRNKGLPDVNGYRRGDLLVSINVWIPKILTKEESKLIEKFGDSANFIPAPDRSEKNFFERMRSYFK